MRAWEYRIVETNKLWEYTEALRVLGENGWELTAVTTREIVGMVHYTLFFKREF